MSEPVHWNLVILFILIMLVVIVKSGDVAMMLELRFPPQILNRDVVVGYRCLKKRDGQWMEPRDK